MKERDQRRALGKKPCIGWQQASSIFPQDKGPIVFLGLRVLNQRQSKKLVYQRGIIRHDCQDRQRPLLRDSNTSARTKNDVKSRRG